VVMVAMVAMVDCTCGLGVLVVLRFHVVVCRFLVAYSCFAALGLCLVPTHTDVLTCVFFHR
jgi:hypothetical protein